MEVGSGPEEENERTGEQVMPWPSGRRRLGRVNQIIGGEAS